MKSTVALRSFLLGSSLALLASQSVHAASGTWTQSVAGTYDWSDFAQWSGGTIADGAGFNAAFNNVGGGNIITTLDSARTIGGISRGGGGTGTQANWTIASASNLLTLDNGASSVGVSNGANAITVLTVDTDILLNSNLVVSANGNNNAAITFGSTVGARSITGAKNITINSSSGFGNGVITFNNNISTSGSFTNAQTGTGGGNVVVNGIIGPNVTGVTQNVTGTAGRSLTLTGANTYTSATTIGAAGSTANRGTITVSGAAGSISGSSAITVNGSGSQLNLDYVGVANGAVDRVGNSTAVTLNYGGELRMNGATAASTSSSESFGTLTLGTGNGIVTINNGGSVSTTDTLTASGFARGSNFSTALVRGSSLGITATVNSKLILTSRTGLTQIGTNTSAAGNDTGTVKNLTIVPYLIGASSGGSVGSNFVTYDTLNGLRRLGTSEQSLVTAGATGDNVRTAAGANAVTGAKVFNSLLLSSGGTGATPGTNPSSVTGDGNSLTLTSGALANVATSATGNVTVSGFSSIIFGTTGANEAVINNTNATAGGTLTIASSINTSSAGGGLTKAGGGLVVLSASNLFTGQTTVNQGTLQIGTGTTGDLGSNTANIVLNGGSLSFGRTNAGLTLSNAISGVGGVTQNGAGGTTVLSGTNTYTGTTTVSNGGGTLQIDTAAALPSGSQISLPKAGTNTGTLKLNTSGTNVYNNPFASFASSNGLVNGGTPNIQNVQGSNTMSGNMTITSGGGNGVNIQSDAGLLTISGNLINSGGSNRPFSFGGAGNGVFSGVMSETSGTNAIIKSGAGTWSVTGTSSSFTGGVNVLDGVLNVASVADTGHNSSIGAGGPINLSGQGTSGTLQYTGSAAVTTNHSLTVAATGGTLDASGTGSGTLKFTGTFSAISPTATNLSYTNGSNVVTNITSITPGTVGGGVMSVTAAGLAPGTTITSISGNTYTLSNPFTGTTGAVNSTFGADVARTLTLTGSNTGANEISSNMGNSAGGGALSVTKTGSGTWVLSGANNTYTGATLVSAGNLFVTGALSSSEVTVAANGTVGGSGTLGNGLTINAGGNLDLTGATLGANSTGILIISGGTLTLGNLTFADLVGWDYANASPGTYELIDGTFSINFGSTAAISPATAFDFGNGKSGYFTTGSLAVVVIPEPTVAALIGAFGGILLLRRRRS
jgi:fibronectin-binding autotransporter adhesin